MTTTLASLKRAAYQQSPEIEKHHVSNMDLAPFRNLVRRVARSFFEAPEIIVLDHFTFMNIPIITDYELAQELKINSRDANKYCGKLVDHRLLRMETNGDQKRPDGKQLTRTYYALDYKLFADVIKWKLLKIDKHIRARMEREMDHRGYVCPECQTKYSALEAMRHCEQFLNDEGQMDFRFVCKIDHILLEEDQHTDALQHGNLVLEELYTQNQKIMDLIRECDQVKLPKYIVMEPPTSVKKFKFDDSLGGTGKGDGGNPSPSHSLPHQHAVKVEFVKETQAPEALPIWHRQSTVIQPLITSHVPDSVPSLTSLQKPTEDTQGVDEYYKTYLTEYSHHHVDLHRSHHPSSTDPIKRSPTLGSQQVEMNEEKEEDGEDVFTDEEFEDPLESIGMELNTTKNQFIVSESTTETLMYEEVNLHLPSESSKEIENSKEEEEEDEEFEFVEIFPS